MENLKMISPITYKQVLNQDGSIDALELWQDGSCITVSFAGKGTHKNYNRWEEVKKVVDNLQELAMEQADKLSNKEFLDYFPFESLKQAVKKGEILWAERKAAALKLETRT